MTSNDIDLRDLAVDRGEKNQQTLRARRSILSRYILPAAMLAGFLALVTWAAKDVLLPPRSVTVVPVFSTTAKVQRGGTPLFQAAGWIEPRPTPLRVAALAPGVVRTLLVVEDQEIKQGDPVAELVRDDAKLAHDAAIANLQLRHAELEEHEATLAAAEVRLKQPVHLEASLNLAQAALASLNTELKKLPYELRRAEADYKALKSDYVGKESASGVIAGTSIDIALGKSNAAKALVEELHDRFDSLSNERDALASRCTAWKTRLGVRSAGAQARDEERAHVKAAKARINQAEVAVAEAKLRLERMTIVAPVDGRVFRLIAHPGASIGTGMTQMEGHDGSTVITMYRPKMLQVRVDTRFEDIPKVSLGQTVKIGNPALPTPLQGTVLFISSEADIQKNTLQVKVAIPDPPEVFKPEMLVDVTFLAPNLPDNHEETGNTIRLYIPQQLIQSDATGPYVWIADQSQGMARKSRVTLGPTSANGLVEIMAGAKVSSRVISSSVEGLVDGTRIQVTDEDNMIGTDTDPLQESNTKNRKMLEATIDATD